MIYLLSVFILFFAVPVFAAPSVTNFNQTTGVITGSGFGTKTTASPSVWDDLEDGAADTTATIGSWSSTNSLDTASISRHSNSSYAGHYNFTGEATAGFRANSSPTSIKWFTQYWFYLSTNWDWGTSGYGAGDQMLSNVKIFRLWYPGTETENFVMATRYSLDSEPLIGVENVAGQVYGSTNGMSKNDMTLGSWHLMQVQFADSTSASAADCTARVWFDGALVADETGLVCRTNDHLKRPYILGFYNSWGSGSDPAGNQEPNDFYIDDVYADTTWSRVEIGNASTYSSCTHREIQIPTAWSDGSITVTVNTGSFSTGNTAYLYVVDSDGTVNSSGYAVTIGSGSSNITCYPDVDNDLYPGTGSESVTTCSTNYYEASHFTAMTIDCDDTDPLSYPGAGSCASSITTPLRTGTQITRTGTTPIRTQ